MNKQDYQERATQTWHQLDISYEYGRYKGYLMGRLWSCIKNAGAKMPEGPMQLRNVDERDLRYKTHFERLAKQAAEELAEERRRRAAYELEVSEYFKRYRAAKARAKKARS